MQALLDEVFILLSQGNTYKVHTLAAHLSQQGLLGKLDDDPTQDLFKRNFVLMHSLYTLQNELVNDGLYLHIDSMDIHLSTQLNLPDLNTPLRDYYLDWHNYTTDNAEIEELLNNFWQKYAAYTRQPTKAVEAHPDMVKAVCQQWDLAYPFTDKQLRKRWRQIALQLHPDKGVQDDELFKHRLAQYQQLKSHAIS